MCLMFLNQLNTLKTLTKAFWGINVFKSNATALKSGILEPLCFVFFNGLNDLKSIKNMKHIKNKSLLGDKYFFMFLNQLKTLKKLKTLKTLDTLKL